MRLAEAIAESEPGPKREIVKGATGRARLQPVWLKDIRFGARNSPLLPPSCRAAFVASGTLLQRRNAGTPSPTQTQPPCPSPLGTQMKRAWSGFYRRVPSGAAPRATTSSDPVEVWLDDPHPQRRLKLKARHRACQSFPRGRAEEEAGLRRLRASDHSGAAHADRFQPRLWRRLVPTPRQHHTIIPFPGACHAVVEHLSCCILPHL